MAFNNYMHPRNFYRVRPNFQQLASEFSEFGEYVIFVRGRVHVNFRDARTLRCLTKTLLKKDFGLNISIPENCLIPTVPQRLNYILWIEDLLNTLPSTNHPVSGIDIGTGPCCIFAVLGARKNGWKFLATESEEESIKWAIKNVLENDLQQQIEVCKVDKEVTLKGAINSVENTFDFCMCNPPFFNDLDEMRKNSYTGGKVDDLKAKQNEVLVEGGEVEFIRKMIVDSMELKEKIKIYTSMFGKKKSLVEIKNDLKNLPNVNFTFTEFCQGNTMRWGVAWTFVEGISLSQVHCSKRKKKKKPINFLIPKKDKGYSIKNMLKWVITILQDLSIQYEIKKETRLNVVLLIQSDENTWSHQRRKRRQAQQQAKMSCSVLVENQNGEAAVAGNRGQNFIIDKNPGDWDVLTTDGSSQSSEDPLQTDVLTTDGSSQSSEDPLQTELVEHMDTEIPSGKNGDLSAAAEAMSQATKILKDMVTKIQSKATIALSENLVSDVDPSIAVNGSQSLSSNVIEMLNTDSGVETTGNLSVGIKRKRDSEDISQGCIVKPAKTVCYETQNTSSTLSTFSELRTVPLLFCNLELKRHCDKIMLEMSCEEGSNRQSMSEVLQLFKNKLM